MSTATATWCVPARRLKPGTSQKKMGKAADCRSQLDRMSWCREALGSAGTAITQEFEVYLKCGRLEHDFLRVRCETYHDEKLVESSPRHPNLARFHRDLAEKLG